MSNVYG